MRSELPRIRVTRLEVPAGGAFRLDRPLTAAGGRVGCATGDDLVVHDLRGGSHRFERQALHALGDEALVTVDPHAMLRRYRSQGSGWVETGRVALPRVPHPVELSPSGRFAAVELPKEGDDGRTVLLVDLDRGEVVGRWPSALHARAAFDRLDGADVLFLSAPSYMAVRMIDCATGGERAYEPVSGTDFCHTDYALSADGERLLTFGCVWAAPYEVRLYDATPWTRGAAPAAGFPLPLLRAQGEDLGCETVLPARWGADGGLSIASLVTTRDLDPEDEPPDDLADAVRALGAEHGLLIRRFDPRTGASAGWTLAPFAAVQETHVHVLPDHQVLGVGDRILRVDGDRLEDLGPSGRPDGWFHSVVVDDTLVLRIASG